MLVPAGAVRAVAAAAAGLGQVAFDTRIALDTFLPGALTSSAPRGCGFFFLLSFLFLFLFFLISLSLCAAGCATRAARLVWRERGGREEKRKKTVGPCGSARDGWCLQRRRPALPCIYVRVCVCVCALARVSFLMSGCAILFEGEGFGVDCLLSLFLSVLLAFAAQVLSSGCLCRRDCCSSKAPTAFFFSFFFFLPLASYAFYPVAQGLVLLLLPPPPLLALSRPYPPCRPLLPFFPPPSRA